MEKHRQAHSGAKPSNTPTEKERVESEVKLFNESKGQLTGYDCPECLNKGTIYVARDNGEDSSVRYETVARRCKCMNIRAEINRMKKSGLENLSKKYTFRNFKTETDYQIAIKKIAKSYVKDCDFKWFYIGGQPGCGKSHICTAIVSELIKAGKEARYMVWVEDASTLKSLTNDQSYDTIIAPYLNVEVLYIDDFLKTRRGENVTNGDINLAFRIINHRYNAGKITIISSEHSLETVIGFDEALGSRIAEKTGTYYSRYIAPDPQKNYRYNN